MTVGVPAALATCTLVRITPAHVCWSVRNCTAGVSTNVIYPVRTDSLITTWSQVHLVIVALAAPAVLVVVPVIIVVSVQKLPALSSMHKDVRSYTITIEVVSRPMH